MPQALTGGVTTQSPTWRNSAAAAQLPQKAVQTAVRRAVPCMDGGVLGHQIRLAPGAHLLGEIGVLHIHEVVSSKPPTALNTAVSTAEKLPVQNSISVGFVRSLSAMR